MCGAGQHDRGGLWAWLTVAARSNQIMPHSQVPCHSPLARPFGGLASRRGPPWVTISLAARRAALPFALRLPTAAPPHNAYCQEPLLMAPQRPSWCPAVQVDKHVRMHVHVCMRRGH